MINPDTAPIEIADPLQQYKSGIAGEADVYVFLSGPNSDYHAGMTVSVVTAKPGEGVDPAVTDAKIKAGANYDPQGPFLLSIAEMSERALALETARRHANDTPEAKATMEFDIIERRSIAG